MARPSRDEEREERITMEIIVDAYGPEEQALGWYYYLEQQLQFPFSAKCIKERKISPLRVAEAVKVTGMAPEEECEHEMFVMIHWQGRDLAVPLAQLQGVRIDAETKQGIEDWHYWLGQGHEL